MIGPEQLRFVRFRATPGTRLLPLGAIVEVIPMVRLLAPEAATDAGGTRFCGLLHYRGRVVPVFDLDDAAKVALGNPEHFLIVTRGHAREQAIVAQDVEGVIEIAPAACTTIDLGPRRLRVVEVEGELIEVVDPDGLAS